MEAVAKVMVASLTPEVVISHKGESLSFSISVFGRSSFQNEYDVFAQINQYWESCSEEVQDEIFKVYAEISFTFNDIFSKAELSDNLTRLVAKLISLHNLELIQDWLAYKSDIIIPDAFQVGYEHSIDNNTSREKTYTRGDYVQLATLSLALRCMIPVWGEYITNIRQETGTQFKEFYAFQLLKDSGIIQCHPIQKLKMYIEHIVGDDKYDANIIIGGRSSEDFSFWLLSLVCIRRLCVGDIRGIDSNANLITFVYKFIIQKIRNNDNNFENVVKEKTFDDRGPEGENKISSLERYKIKTNISLGEIVELEYSLKNIIEVANKLTCKMDPFLLERSLQTSQHLQQERLLDPQMTLLRWVFKPVISSKGLMYLPKNLVVKAIGAMEAVLWARGHKYLAVLCSSYPIMSDNVMTVSPMDSKKRVPEELSAELDKIYPFKAPVGKSKVSSKEVNYAAKSIDTLTTNFTMFSWRPTAHESMLYEVFGNTNRRVPIKSDIKEDLTKLVIEIGTRSWF